MIKTAIFGASGYTGQELMRLLSGHPEVKVVAATSRRFAGKPVSEVYPVLSGRTDLIYKNETPEAIAGQVDFVRTLLRPQVGQQVLRHFAQKPRRR